jgi:hypothetical protein
MIMKIYLFPTSWYELELSSRPGRWKKNNENIKQAGGRAWMLVATLKKTRAEL